MSLRIVEWTQLAGAERHPGRREVLPAAEAAEAIAAGQAVGIRLVLLKASVGNCNVGETCGWPDHVAERLIGLDLAEPAPVRAPAGNLGAEDKAIDRPPADRMVRNATRKEVKP